MSKFFNDHLEILLDEKLQELIQEVSQDRIEIDEMSPAFEEYEDIKERIKIFLENFIDVG